jgi:DNA-binding HxlR family transcriptional regulator
LKSFGVLKAYGKNSAAKGRVVKSDSEIDWRSVCPISSALDVLGDKWSLLIIRDLIVHGPRTYSELLKSPEHISTNILAARLDLLVGLKLIQRVNPQASQRNNAFQLTESGAELRPILIALGGWAQVHLKHYHADILGIDTPNHSKKSTQ